MLKSVLKSGHDRPDVGRLVMVPAAAVMLAADAIILAHSSSHGFTGVLRWIGNVLVVAFYALIIWAYVRRGPAKATTSSIIAHVAAVIATLTPFVVPMLAGGTIHASRQLVSDILLVVGTAWSLWSLRSLGK